MEWKPLTVGDLQKQIDEQNDLIDVLRLQMKEQHEKLRDRFAMAALTGMLANESLNAKFDGYADDAYRYADAMMKERERK